LSITYYSRRADRGCSRRSSGRNTANRTNSKITNGQLFSQIDENASTYEVAELLVEEAALEVEEAAELKNIASINPL
jgi:hypothetical protein